MYQIEACRITDIPDIDRRAKRNNDRKQYKSKWHRIIDEFLDSGMECVKITPDAISARNASIALSLYLRHHGTFPIAYAQRGDSIYIYKKEI